MKALNLNMKNLFGTSFNKVKMSFVSVFDGDATDNQQMVVYGCLAIMGIITLVIICSITGILSETL